MMDGLELQMLLKLGLVLLLIFPALWVLRRLVGAPAAIGRGKVIHVLEIQPLPEGQRLYLVRVQGRHLLLGGCKESRWACWQSWRRSTNPRPQRLPARWDGTRRREPWPRWAAASWHG